LYHPQARRQSMICPAISVKDGSQTLGRNRELANPWRCGRAALGCAAPERFKGLSPMPEAGRLGISRQIP